MDGMGRRWVHHGEAFWRVHHEAWKRGDLNPGGIVRPTAFR